MSVFLRALAALLLATAAGAYEPPAKFLIVSNAQTGLISYGRLPPKGGNITNVRTLIEAGNGLVHPQGLAVDQKRRLLLVADSGIQKIVSYGLATQGEKLVVDEQTSVVENVEARWVAVDGIGNMFYSDEANNKLFMKTAQEITDGNTNGGTSLDAASAVSAPGGVASDNFYLYWTNKAAGQTAGSVVRTAAPSTAYPSSSPATSATPSPTPTAGPTVEILAQQRALRQGSEHNFEILETNTDKSYGLCLAQGQMFYTDPEKNVWAANKTGVGNPVAVTTKLMSPRGCAWDGLSLLYVADRSAGGVFALPAPQFALAETTLHKVASVEEAFGLAIFSAASHTLSSVALLLALVTAGAWRT